MVTSLSRSRFAALVALVVAALAVGCKKSKPTEAANPGTNAPSVAPGPTGGSNPTVPAPKAATPSKVDGATDGWSEARDAAGGFRVLVPGTARPLDMTTAPAWRKQLQMTMISAGKVLDPNVPLVQTYSLVPPAGFKLGSTPDELYAALLLHEQGVMTFQDVVSKESVKLGGRSGLKVVAKSKNTQPPKVPDDPEAEQRFAEAYKKSAAQRNTYFVATTATRVIVILVQSQGDPNPEHLKAITGSFAFL